MMWPGCCRAWWPHPDTFLRLFCEAMSHRDLVVLAEDGGDGLGRVYSTGAQVRGELAAVDLGTRLALGAAAEYAPALAMTSGDAVDLSAGPAGGAGAWL